jgi:PPOX class probable F420-dependent enzyme
MTDRPLPDRVRAFLDDERYATITTIDPDGAPRQAVVWYTLDGDEFVINSRIGRRWPSNLLRDPRIALSVIDTADGARWAGLTGTVRPITDHATTQADIAGMARRYDADDPDAIRRSLADFESQERISFRFRPTSVHDHLEDA